MQLHGLFCLVPRVALKAQGSSVRSTRPSLEHQAPLPGICFPAFSRKEIHSKNPPRDLVGFARGLVVLVVQQTKRVPSRTEHPSRVDFKFFLLLGYVGTCFFPTGDAGGKVLYVLVAELLGSGSASLVGLAPRTTAIGNDQGLLVLWEKLTQVFAFAGEVYGSRDVPFLKGAGAVDVDDGNLACLDGGLEILDADVGIFPGVNGSRKQSGDE